MQQFAQSSTSPGNMNMDMSVLERQTATLQRLYHNQENDHLNLHSPINQQVLLSNCNSWQPVNPDRQYLPYPETHSPSSMLTNNHQSFSAVSNSNNSSSTPQCNISIANRQANVKCSIKKRKAEFDIEDEGKDKEVEAEDTGEERSEITTTNNSSKISEVQKPDFIHVRARRGQATDSHSLAERARREKISKKMKCLQDLVPGCNKVTGKSGMLDEIINYVQSLQKQVEFLSMKLASSNPRLDFSIDNLFAKEIPAYIASLPAAVAQLEANNAACFPYNLLHQGSSNHGANIAFDQSQMLLQKLESGQIPEAFLPQLQQISGWDPDLTSLFNAGFH